MREMRDSGVFYIGYIPASWSVAKYKYFSQSRMGETILTTDLVENGIPVYSATNDNTLFGYVADASVVLKQGDLVVPARGNSIGFMKFVEHSKATCTQTTICSYNIHGIENKYLYYCSYAFKEDWYKYDGSAIPQVTVEALKNNFLSYPPLHEQKTISEYLDCKCSQIDSVVSKQMEQIERLREYKRSLIAETVTKGLYPNVEMKDSGNSFLGSVPAHWEVLKFGHCIDVKSNLVNPNDYSDYPQISPESIEKGTARIRNYQSVDESGVISWNHLFFKGQIIYSKIRPLLDKVIIAPFDGLCSADMYPIETNNDALFIMYLMLSNSFHSQVALVTENRVKMPKINQNELSSIIVALPPIDEQREISGFLSRKCYEIDSDIAQRIIVIEKYEELKKSLIYEVVTGKKEV
ncbi:type I restriction enzyme, S subunit [Ruminococcaceae bacterium YRB3002]|nr:type I restriction enzyme, S subunit [Ruminococcaceae bacterium YRB3002]